MLAFFIKHYVNFSVDHFLNTLFFAIGLTIFFADLKKNKKLFYRIPLSILFNFVLINIVSAVFYWISPTSSFGYFINPAIYVPLSLLAHPKKDIRDKVARGILFVCRWSLCHLFWCLSSYLNKKIQYLL